MTRTIVFAVALSLPLVALAVLTGLFRNRHLEANKALGRSILTEIYEKKNFALADQLYADDFVDDSRGGGKGRELIEQAVSDFHTAVPDLRVDFEDIFAADDKVVQRFVARGTQTGPYGAIPPTGKNVDVES